MPPATTKTFLPNAMTHRIMKKLELTSVKTQVLFKCKENSLCLCDPAAEDNDGERGGFKGISMEFR